MKVVIQEDHEDLYVSVYTDDKMDRLESWQISKDELMDRLPEVFEFLGVDAEYEVVY